MKTLIINAHPDPHSACSATNRMVAHLLAKLPAGSAEVVNLAESKQPSLDKAVLDIFIKTVFRREQPTAEETQYFAGIHANVAQLKAAPRLVIAYPMYNFGIPARLKDWIDSIVVPDETFRYNANGNPEGLLTTHKALILQASGGVFSEGGRAAMEHTVPYLQDVLRLLGFVSVDAVRAEGTTKTTGLDAAVAKACADIDAKMDTFTR
ncbi:MAG: FMN-dependent NADH-azoreductase [Cardiobacterium sp.]|jgi:FMN-dependent NADH-azoreductase